MNETKKGTSREAALTADVYFSEHYFSMRQLCTHAHQLHLINSMAPRSVLEIGIGNGLVSSFLRRAGIDVTTADINPALNPDICAPLAEVRNHTRRDYDVVVCCEVLEHMPLEELDENLLYLSDLGDRLFLTLPNAKPSAGLSGFLFLPKIGERMWDFTFDLPVRRSLRNGPHFWEVGSERKCSVNALKKRLKMFFSHVRSGRFALNPYHLWFMCARRASDQV